MSKITLYAAHLNGGYVKVADRDQIKLVAPIQTCPTPTGIVLTHLQSCGSHVLYHPVFKLPQIGQYVMPNRFTPAAKEKYDKGRGGQHVLRGCTSAIVSTRWTRPNKTLPDFELADVLQGFAGVCMSETQLEPLPSAAAAAPPSPKRRKVGADPRVLVAVAGTVTMPYFEGAEPTKDGSVILPGDLVAFAVVLTQGGAFQPDDLRAVAGTLGRPGAAVEYVPRIRKFDSSAVFQTEVNKFKNNCSAPFGVCVELDAKAGQITVLLRMDLYHSYFYDFHRAAHKAAV